MNRRDYLKGSAVLLAGAVVPGCDGQGANDADPTGVQTESGGVEMSAACDEMARERACGSA